MIDSSQLNEKRKAALDWMNAQGQLNIGLLAEEDFNILQGSIGSRQFGLWLALLQNMRAEAAALLVNIPLGTAERDAAAAVLQGQCRAVDTFRQMVLDIADPQVLDAAEPEQEGAGFNG